MPAEILVLVVVLVGLEVLRRALGIQPPGVPSFNSLVILGALVVLVVGAIWYFTVYDTAGGRCSRGDLGACLVYEAQQHAR